MINKSEQAEECFLMIATDELKIAGKNFLIVYYCEEGKLHNSQFLYDSSKSNPC